MSAPAPSQARNGAAPKRRGRQLSPGGIRAASGVDWVVLSISARPDDLPAWDAMVARCRRAGLSNMSRSQLIRIAMIALDLDAMIRPGGVR